MRGPPRSAGRSGGNDAVQTGDVGMEQSNVERNFSSHSLSHFGTRNHLDGHFKAVQLACVTAVATP